VVKALDHITGAINPHLKVSMTKKANIILEFYFYSLLFTYIRI